MLAVKFYDEDANEMLHYYSMYTLNEHGLHVVWHSNYKSPWDKDLSIDELRKATGNYSISGIIHTDVSIFSMQQFEYCMMDKVDYYKFVDEEFKKGKSIEQIDAEWIKQQKIAAISEAAKEYK